MNNITYNVEEKEETEEKKIHLIYENLENKNFVYEDSLLFDNYNELNIKQLNLICDYYKIKKNNISKKDKIIKIIIFENDINNILEVENRKLLWEYLKVIKSDNFLSKYLIIDI